MHPVEKKHTKRSEGRKRSFLDNFKLIDDFVKVF